MRMNMVQHRLHRPVTGLEESIGLADFQQLTLWFQIL